MRTIIIILVTLLAVEPVCAQQQLSPYEQIADDNIRMGEMQSVIGKLQKQALAFQRTLADADATQDELQDAEPSQ